MPTVTGRLSFSAIGRTTHPRRCVQANVDDGQVRYVICYQARDLLDAAIPHIIAEKIFGARGRMWLVLVSRTVPEGDLLKEILEGRILLFHDKARWEVGGKSLVETIQSRLRSWPHRDEKTSLPIDFHDEYEALRDSLSSESSFYADFTMARSGKTTFVHDTSWPVTASAPKGLAGPTGVRLQKLIPSQLFYFLRDISHHHQHHDPATDTIVDLYPEGGATDWRHLTLFSMFRKIIDYKRNPSATALTASKGVLAYAEAFSNVCSKDKKYIPPHFDWNAVKDSLSAGREELERRRTQSRLRRNTVWGVSVGAIGLVLALVGLLSLSDFDLNAPPNVVLTFLAESLVTSFWVSVALFVVMMIVVMVAAGAIDPFEWRVMKNVVRLVQPFSQGIAVLIMGCIGLLTIAVYVKLVFF